MRVGEKVNTHPVRDFVRAVIHARQDPDTRIVSLEVEFAE